MFAKLLVANRGEIAVRVMRTCRRLGIRTVGVYSDADARGLHVRMADEAYRLGPAAAADSYLRSDRLLDVARQSGATAVHPGYGFLAENPDFAQACLDAGLVWVGPTPEAMRALGDKARAKALAEEVGVPVLPGYHGADQHPATLARRAHQIGFPVLIKASAGGGGRGMRVVEQPATFTEALESARREAAASFGNDRVLLERYLPRARHVEVQVLGDAKGSLIHLGERECSIQRRHQKLIEESPSPAVDAGLRDAIGEAALRVARAARYTNAGTVEFLLDERDGFAFLEVNARLQVEHPVTELVTGLDLVEEQLGIADGSPLRITQSDVKLQGHAIEVRVLAEDASFLPSTGRIEDFEPPPWLRTETGVATGAEVTSYYDSLLAKLIAGGPDRPTAIAALVDGLAAFEIAGVKTNIDLLLATIQTSAFIAGDLHTGFLAESRVVQALAEPPVEVIAAAAMRDVRPSCGSDPWHAAGPWRLARLEQPSRLLAAGTPVEAFVTRNLETEQATVRIGDQVVVALPAGVPDNEVHVNGELARVNAGTVEWRGRTYRVRRQRALEIDQVAHDQSPGGGGRLTAPMPGRVVKLAVAAGDQVRANQPLLVLEAMKMEHVVEAPHPGVVREVSVQAGQQVAAGALLLELGALE